MLNSYKVALYTVNEARRRNFDPMMIVNEFCNRIHDLSTYGEDLAAEIYLVQKYRIDEKKEKEAIEEIRQEMEGTKEFKILKEVIDEICKKNKGKEVIR